MQNNRFHYDIFILLGIKMEVAVVGSGKELTKKTSLAMKFIRSKGL